MATLEMPKPAEAGVVDELPAPTHTDVSFRSGATTLLFPAAPSHEPGEQSTPAPATEHASPSTTAVNAPSGAPLVTTFGVAVAPSTQREHSPSTKSPPLGKSAGEKWKTGTVEADEEDLELLEELQDDETEFHTPQATAEPVDADAKAAIGLTNLRTASVAMLSELLQSIGAGLATVSEAETEAEPPLRRLLDSAGHAFDAWTAASGSSAADERPSGTAVEALAKLDHSLSRIDERVRATVAQHVSDDIELARAAAKLLSSCATISRGRPLSVGQAGAVLPPAVMTAASTLSRRTSRSSSTRPKSLTGALVSSSPTFATQELRDPFKDCVDSAELEPFLAVHRSLQELAPLSRAVERTNRSADQEGGGVTEQQDHAWANFAVEIDRVSKLLEARKANIAVERLVESPLTSPKTRSRRNSIMSLGTASTRSEEASPFCGRPLSVSSNTQVVEAWRSATASSAQATPIGSETNEGMPSPLGGTEVKLRRESSSLSEKTALTMGSLAKGSMPPRYSGDSVRSWAGATLSGSMLGHAPLVPKHSLPAYLSDGTELGLDEKRGSTPSGSAIAPGRDDLDAVQASVERAQRSAPQFANQRAVAPSKGKELERVMDRLNARGRLENQRAEPPKIRSAPAAHSDDAMQQQQQERTASTVASSSKVGLAVPTTAPPSHRRFSIGSKFSSLRRSGSSMFERAHSAPSKDKHRALASTDARAKTPTTKTSGAPGREDLDPVLDDIMSACGLGFDDQKVSMRPRARTKPDEVLPKDPRSSLASNEANQSDLFDLISAATKSRRMADQDATMPITRGSAASSSLAPDNTAPAAPKDSGRPDAHNIPLATETEKHQGPLRKVTFFVLATLVDTADVTCTFHVPDSQHIDITLHGPSPQISKQRVRSPAPLMPGSQGQAAARVDHFSFSVEAAEAPLPEAPEFPLCAAALQKDKPRGFSCAACGAPLVDLAAVASYHALPSRHWEELADAWMCHDDQEVHASITRSKENLFHGRALAETELWVDDRHMVASPGLLVVDGVSTAAPSEEKMTQQVSCRSCGLGFGQLSWSQEPDVGAGAGPPKHLRLDKFALTQATDVGCPLPGIDPSSSSSPPSPQTNVSGLVLCELVRSADVTASRRFLLTEEGPTSRARLAVWLFSLPSAMTLAPTAWKSTGPSVTTSADAPAGARASGPGARPEHAGEGEVFWASKVLFQTVAPAQAEESVDGDAAAAAATGLGVLEVMELPARVCDAVEAALTESHALFPASASRIGEWRVGLLRSSA